MNFNKQNNILDTYSLSDSTISTNIYSENNTLLFYINLTDLIKNLISGIKDKNNKLISEFRFIKKEEYGPYKPYLTYELTDPERTIIVVKIWLYMLFKKAYTLKHINKEHIKVYIKYKQDELPYIYLGLNKLQYNKLIHPKNLGQFKDIKETNNIEYNEDDICITLYINDKDVDIKNVKKYNNKEWINLCLSDQKYDYYMYKFNPFVFNS
jgi:hypothetical protein